MPKDSTCCRRREPRVVSPAHAHGVLYLVPNLLGAVAPDAVLPARTLDVARRLDHWLVETPKAARAFLKSLALARPIASLTMAALPTAPDASAFRDALAALRNGSDTGLLSDAGCPGVADPGAALVAAAHAAGDSRRSAGRTVGDPARADGVGNERPAVLLSRLPAGPAGCAHGSVARARTTIAAPTQGPSYSSKRPTATSRCSAPSPRRCSRPRESASPPT